MKLSESVKPVRYLKSHTAEALDSVEANGNPMVISQHGEAGDVQQELLALLKMLSQSSKNIREGRFKPLKKGFDDIRQQLREVGG